MTASNEPAGAQLSRRSWLGAMIPVLIGARRGYTQGMGPGGDGRQGIADLYDALRASMRMGTASAFQSRFDRIAPVVDRVFDLDTILRISVGLIWSSLAEPARQTLAAVFRTFTIATYAANFDNEGGERFEVLPGVRASGNDQVVQSRLLPANGDPVEIDYVMRSEPQGWRIVDVLLDGTISRVAVQRSDFRALLASGDPTRLIDSLRTKIAELSGGAMRP